MHLIYGVIALIIHINVNVHRVSKVFSIKEKIGLPEISQEFQVSFPICYNAIENRTKKFVLSYFCIKSSYQQRDIFSGFDFTICHFFYSKVTKINNKLTTKDTANSQKVIFLLAPASNAAL